MAAERWAEDGSSLSHMVRWVEQMTGIEITADPAAKSHCGSIKRKMPNGCRQPDQSGENSDS